MSESLAGGIGAGLFLAFSYTFWSQAITAEVYTLHLMMVGAAGLAAMAWADRPTTGRLALFYAVFALGFGNHLSMVLLLPAFTVFLLMHRRPGAADPLRPRHAGDGRRDRRARRSSIRMEPSRACGQSSSPRRRSPRRWRNSGSTSRRQDWRETLVNDGVGDGTPASPGDVLVRSPAAGSACPASRSRQSASATCSWRWPKRAVFLLLFYAANLAFAWTYNVGDAYIFFLPSHYVVALCAGAGIAAVGGARVACVESHDCERRRAGCCCSIPPGAGTTRCRRSIAAGIVEPSSCWTNSRTITSAVYRRRHELASAECVRVLHARAEAGSPVVYTEELEWLQGIDRDAQRFNALVDANAGDRPRRARSRSGPAAARVIGSAGQSASSTERQAPRPHFSDARRGPFGRELHTSSRYCAPIGSIRSIPSDSDRRGAARTGGSVNLPDMRNYIVVVGRVGERPCWSESQDRRTAFGVTIEPFDLDVRMESWLPTDTIRRAGFGHVIVNRHHVLTLERGISFVALGPRGRHRRTAPGLFAPIPRYRLPIRRRSVAQQRVIVDLL